MPLEAQGPEPRKRRRLSPRGLAQHMLAAPKHGQKDTHRGAGAAWRGVSEPGQGEEARNPQAGQGAEGTHVGKAVASETRDVQGDRLQHK